MGSLTRDKLWTAISHLAGKSLLLTVHDFVVGFGAVSV